MAVAKSYAKCKIDGEPFRENGRMYVNVLVAGKAKKVRWYTDAEYAKMYPSEEVHNIMDFNARHVFGFGVDGYITIYRGDKDAIQEFRENHQESFRFNLTFGVYTPSRIPLCDLPEDIVGIRLDWQDVMDHDDRMRPHEEVQKVVARKLGTLTESKYQGTVNEWLQKIVTVIDKKSQENHFGTKHIYTLKDNEGNLYSWETSAKDYPCDKTVVLKMKVKEHKEINGNEVTVVWYCKET